MMMTKDRAGGIVFAVFGIAVAVLATQIKMRANLSEPGPRLFPYIAGIGMALCGLGMALTAKKDGNNEAYLTKAGWKRLGIAASVLFLYYLALEYIGFIISTPLFTFAIILILASEKKINRIAAGLISLATTGILYFLFQHVFMIFLPEGRVFF
ncbi:tripartite tricarboxylate transporter TctB family protein [Treponema sp. OttesenSCG-928-L16]|nr:tripartite tricarboxylate transporter TctB family protein [Treponema sp. OttesenSCG-928-L16]